MSKPLIVAILSFSFLVPSAWGKQPDAVETVRSKLAKLVPETAPDSIKPTPIKDLYEVVYGAQVMYVSAEGRYLLRGNLIDLDQRQDLTEQTRSRARREALSKVDESEMIVFSPTSKKPRHTITVFTDVDCPYCRKLHSEIDEYTNAGIKVRYLMFPRMGKNSPSYYKAVNVWCAKDRNEALTEAKQGKELPKRTCKNPVQSQMELGQLIGVNGTPATVLENGEMVPGYRPAKEMVRLLAQSDSDD